MSAGFPERSKTASFQVDLEVSSWIEGRGVRHTNWSVRVNDAWVPVAKLRGVAATMPEPTASFADDAEELRVLPRGCQSRITYHPLLPGSTQLLRRVSVPYNDEEIQRRSRSMAGSWRLPLAVTTTVFRVVGPNRIVREERWQLRRQREEHRRKEPVRERRISPAELDVLQARLRETLAPKVG
jgi:hypothetical protein